jgi:signal transduction histidine kinase/DNA-binding response OmpR family regulator/HPt (histidine-containing phosphotransfer) domain-containing protein
MELGCRVLRPDGTRRHVRIHGRPCPMHEDGSCYLGTVLDVTEQVLAERRLRQNNLVLTAILENIPCGLTVFGPEGNLVLDNQKARPLLGPAGALPDTDFGMLDAGSGLAAAGPDTVSSAPTPPDFNPSPRIREEVQPDGRVFEVRDAPLPAGGVVTTYTDVTQQKQFIETLQRAKLDAEQAAAAKAAFLAAMSHEIRTPMNGVIGMTNLLLATQLTPAQGELVGVIQQCGESLLVIINDILDYSKIESGQMELDWQPFRLSDVVQSSVKLLAGKAREKQIVVAVDQTPANVPALIMGDRMRVQQVLVNLLGNAVKFTDEGEVRISVANRSWKPDARCGQAPGDLCELTVTVQDTGVGIPAEKLASIFEPFVQADNSSARRFEGTGLGLTIARRLADAMGGGVELESQEGEGTTARFTFVAETAMARFDEEGDAAPLFGKTAVLVTDRRADPGVLVQMLKRWGMRLRICTGVKEGLSTLAGGEAVDLMLLVGPFVDRTGMSVVADVRASGSRVPVVLLSRRKAARADPGLGAWTVPRTGNDANLYDTLMQALRSSELASNPSNGPETGFDATLAQRNPLRILLVEDNEVNRQVGLRMLGAFGYEADIAPNGLEALAAVSRTVYDLLLMDLQMPVMDGLEATRRIVATMPPGQRPRIVAMSANVMREHVESALQAGADDYVAKPFRVRHLRSLLEQTDARRPVDSLSCPAPPSPDDPLLAKERIAVHLRADPDGGFLDGLVDSFDESSRDLLARLRIHWDGNDPVAARAVVHEHAGMCGVVGAHRLMNALLRVQQALKEDDMARARGHLHACEQIHADTVRGLRDVAEQHRRARLSNKP